MMLPPLVRMPDLVISATMGSAVIAQTLTEGYETGERLGTVSVLVMGAYFLVRYFMGVVDRKDALLEAKSKEYTQIMLDHLHQTQESRIKLAEALERLTQVVSHCPVHDARAPGIHHPQAR